MKTKFLTIATLWLLTTLCVMSQQQYNYSIDLTAVTNDKLKVSLKTPQINQNTISFFMPKIIPGTYRESNFGQFVSDFKAFDSKGKELPVKKVNQNQWEISKAKNLESITYWVEDIFDTEIENQIYRMSATNIEEGKNFVISTPGFFGYLDEMKKLPFEVSFKKPVNFYGTTGLKPTTSTSTLDVFRTSDYDELVDSPIMFNEPDTTEIKIGNTEVVVSVFSKMGVYTSKMIAEKLEPLLQATAKYLGGNLPTDKYAFIMYFDDPAKASPLQGALEHNISSFYYLPEYPAEMLLPQIVDIAAHEFFHIVTPLTIHSEEIQFFDFNNPILSEHLWLYEGSTEYASDHVQVKYGLDSKQEFLDKLVEKIKNSKTKYNDRLPFTELSKQAASEHASQYGNVYEKGALIAAMLDIRLLDLSNGKFGLVHLMDKLSKKYGKHEPFQDKNLFNEIVSVSGLDVKDFFEKYVDGTYPLPLEEYFGKVGIEYKEEAPRSLASLGHIAIGYDQEQGRLAVMDISQADVFGKQMGYQKGDLIYSINGKNIDPAAAQNTIKEYGETTQEGSIVKVIIGRKDDSGNYKKIELSAPAIVKSVPGKTILRLIESPSKSQLRIRSAWLDAAPVDPNDIASIDSLMAAFYDVISGPAGERDWNRFMSLFSENAQMTALSPNQQGQTVLVKMTPEEYKIMNGPTFLKEGFWEEEYGRETSLYNNAAVLASVYGYTFQKGTPPVQRGINFISVAFFEGRWWITNVLWNHETPQNPIPSNFLNAD